MTNKDHFYTRVSNAIYVYMYIYIEDKWSVNCENKIKLLVYVYTQ